MTLTTVSSDRLSTNVKNTNFTSAEKQDLTDDILPLAGQLGNRNLVINGAMKVAQRGTTSTSSGYHTVDRFKAEGSNTGQTATQSQQDVSASDTPYTLGFRKYMRIALASAGTANANANVEIQQRIEAQILANSGWNVTSSSSNITLSFWFRPSTNQTFYCYIRSYDGTGQQYAFSFTASGNNTWTKITKTIPGNSNLTIDNNTGAGLQIVLTPFYGTNYTNNLTLNQWAVIDNANYLPDMASTWLTTGTPTFDVTGVQLEVGSVATDFEHRSVHDELIRCMRYCVVYEHQLFNETLVFIGASRSSTAKFFTWPLSTPMRADPTVTRFGPTRLGMSDFTTEDATSTLTVGGVTPTTQLVQPDGPAVGGDKLTFFYSGSVSGMTNQNDAFYQLMFVSDTTSGSANKLTFDSEL